MNREIGKLDHIEDVLVELHTGRGIILAEHITQFFDSLSGLEAYENGYYF